MHVSKVAWLIATMSSLSASLNYKPSRRNLHQGWQKGIEKLSPKQSHKSNIFTFDISVYCNLQTQPMEQVEKDDFFFRDHCSLVCFACVTGSRVVFCQADAQWMVESEEDDADVECVGPEGLGATTSDGG